MYSSVGAYYVPKATAPLTPTPAVEQPLAVEGLGETSDNRQLWTVLAVAALGYLLYRTWGKK